MKAARPLILLVFLITFVFCTDRLVLHAQATDRTTLAAMTGEQLYQAACAACHGADGKGQPQAVRAFDLDVPDFTDCGFNTAEAHLDWVAVAHQGGPVRAFDPMMPAFGDALSVEEIGRVIDHVRAFCSDTAWPRGDLNLPRPFVTEKAFPENEAVLTTTIVASHGKSVSNQFLYEHRVGPRGQYEIFVPVALRQGPAGAWSRGLGDVGAAYKHVLFDSLVSGSIFSAGGEIVFPTGKEGEGLGGGVTIFEPFVTLSQMLPSDGFLHLHAGVEVPSDTDRAPKETFWRAALGKTYMEGSWGRAWSPMVELLGARAGDDTEWDIVPEMQVSLSTRQHILLNVGMRVPLNERESRSKRFLVYLLWDWFDGGLFTGW